MQRRTQHGFTLIEIMVVVVILGILAALVVPQIMSRPDQAKVTVAKNDIKAISAALDMYKLDNYSYPSTQQGLEALVRKPSGNPTARNWNPDGYLKRLPVDPWGNPYQYLAPGSKGAFDLYSLGADGRQDGADRGRLQHLRRHPRRGGRAPGRARRRRDLRHGEPRRAHARLGGADRGQPAQVSLHHRQHREPARARLREG